MAEKTYIVKLAGDSKSYQSSVDQARKSLDAYQKQNLSTGAAIKNVTSALTKFVSVAALAKGAQEAFTRVIKGSQTTADAWAATMKAVRTSVDNFFTSISTGDFSSFNMGLQKIASNAKAAAAALDSLGNASMSWSYFQTAGTADLTELQAIVNDSDRSIADRSAAAQQMAVIRDRLQKYANNYEKVALEAMAKEMTAATNIPWTNVSRADLENILELDLLGPGMSQDAKNALAARYKEYTTKLKQIKPVEAYQYTLNGNVIRNENPQDRERYNAEVRALADSYQDAILFNEVLVRKSDEWLQNLIAIVQQADNAARSMRRVNSTVMGAEKTVSGLAVTAPSAPTRQMGTLPGPSGIALMDVSGPVLPKVLPETVVQLEDTEALMARIAANADTATDSFNSVGHALESLGSTFGQFEGTGWQMAGSILASTGAVVEAYNKIAQAAAIASAAEAAGETPTVWGKIAAITAMLGAFAGMVASVKSSVRTYAEGGIIPGQNYNDGITARVSSGEMIINQADQKRLYDSIHTGGVGGGSVRSSISGEQIVIAVNNWARRTNHGELVFAGRG